ncbi:glycerophosphoryl diester phosphodiesterase membrane domain-containing protein [Patescibacteria group bacterium]|nr:glycerophosphoryl diester phosphodiesterase membrane domain-containing protein [Patescibacteria group bacterium]
MVKFSKKEAIKFGYKKVKKHFWLVVLITLIVVGINTLQPFLQELPFLQNNSFSAGLAKLAISLLFTIIGIIVQIGLIKVSIKFAKGEMPAVVDLFYDKPFIRYLLTVILSGIIIVFGFILFIIPGIILALRLQFAPYLVIDKKTRVMESIKKSWNMTSGQAWNLFLFGLLLAVLNILGALLLGVGLLITIPIAAIAVAFVYLKLLE